MRIIIYLISIILILIIIRLVYYFFLTKNYKKINIDEVLNVAETGDIILFKYKDKYFLDIKKHLLTFFSHCGMVVENDNNKYILENFSKNDYNKYNNKGGATLIDLKSRIKDYNGSVFIIKLKNKLDLDRKNTLINKLETYLKYNYYENYEKFMFQKCILNFKMNKNENELICSEFVFMILKDLNLINYKEYISCKTPWNIFNLEFYDKYKFYKIMKN